MTLLHNDTIRLKELNQIGLVVYFVEIKIIIRGLSIKGVRSQGK